METTTMKASRWVLVWLVATVATAPHFADFTTGDSAPNVRNLVVAEARLLELGIREYRAGTSWAKAG